MLGRHASIVVVSIQTMLAFCLPTLPTPLYRLYESQLHFSVLMLTFIFSAYIIGTLSTLLFLGNLSDQWGRRRITLIGIGMSMLTMLLFIFARNVFMLFLARVCTGLSTGVMSGTVIAWMRDLHDQADKRSAALRSVTTNILGLGLGPLVAGLLVAFAPHPLTLVYWVFIGLFTLQALAVWRTEETVERQARTLSLKPELGLPPELRIKFLSPAISVFSLFSLVGFYSAIIPSLLAKTLHLPSPATTGAVVFTLFAAGALAVLLTRKVKSWPAMLSGASLMLPTLLLVVLAQRLHSLGALLAGTVLGGAAIGIGYRGVLEVINQIAPPDQRASLVSSLFVVGNLSMSIPVIGIGLTATFTSPTTANYVFAAVIAVFAISGTILGVKLRTDD